MIAGAMFDRPSGFRVPGAPARCISSANTTCSMMPAPRPPYSCGPRDRGVAGIGERAVPPAELLEPVGRHVHREAGALAAELVGELVVEPGPELLAERLGLGRVGEVHQASTPPRASAASISAALRTFSVVQLLGGAEHTVDLELAHDVHLAERLVHVARAVGGRDEPAGGHIVSTSTNENPSPRTWVSNARLNMRFVRANPAALCTEPRAT